MPDTIKIAVCDDWEQAALDCADWTELQQLAQVHFFNTSFESEAAAAQALKDFDAICLMRERMAFPKSLIDQLPRLKRLIFSGQRNLVVDIEHATKKGIEVSGTPGGPNKASTAEHTWSLILAATRRVVTSMNGTQAGHWRGDTQGEPYRLPETLEGDRLGIIGLGDIGQRVGRIGQAMGMEVVAWSQNLTDEKAAAAGVRRVEKNELLATSKVVSLHLVLSERTKRIIGPTEYSLMRRDSLLVNTSRSGLMDVDALIPALDSGRPMMAAVDVFDVEPVSKGNVFFNHPKVVATPHLGFVSVPVFEAFYRTMVQDLTKWIKTQTAG